MSSWWVADAFSLVAHGMASSERPVEGGYPFRNYLEGIGVQDYPVCEQLPVYLGQAGLVHQRREA